MAVKDVLPRMSSRQVIATSKGCLAYTIAFILIFIHSFSRLNPYPVTLSGAVLITIAGQPGLAVGACWDQAIFAALGVGLGGGAFAILAKLGHSRVAQGFIFAVMVYFAALVKAQSLRYFGMSLLFIILAFSGIYTSALSSGIFVPEYLEAYLASYCWGFAIVLVVNLVVLPHSSEKELREILVISLEHISTFSHLIAKTYNLDLSDEERVARDALNQSIRADMGVLNQKLAQAGLEINYSRWSMQDYSLMVAKIRAMQHGLITSYSSLVSMEQYDPRALEIIKQELHDTAASKSFNRLRRGADLSFADIVAELAVGKAVYHSPAPGERHWDDFKDEHDSHDLEAGRHRARGFSLSRPAAQPESMQQRVAAKLRKEVATAGSTPTVSRRPSVSGAPDSIVNSSFATEAAAALAAAGAEKDRKLEDKVAFMRGCWKTFEDSQLAAIQSMLATGLPDDDELRLHRPGPSMAEQYLNPPARFDPRVQAATTATEPSSTAPSLAKRATDGSGSGDDKEKAPPSSYSSAGSDTLRTSEMICGSAVMRTFAFLAGMGAVVNELASLYEHIVPKPGDTPRRKKLRFHVFERKAQKVAAAPGPSEKSKMTLREAIARLSGRDFVPPTRTVWQRIAQLERLARSPDSIYAAKTAAAVSVYAVFILAPSLTSFFVDYGLTSGIITIVVAMSPTLGQTLLTFVIQILGTGFGSVLGLLILRIFLDVGGYTFNPYGIVCLLALAAWPLSAIIYVKPQFFAGALLAMNAAGVLVITLWTYNEVPGQIRPFDSPAYRCAKQLVAMCIALAIAGIFQIFILRQPARQNLRQKVARISWSLNALAVLFSYLSEAMMPMMADSSKSSPPDWEAVAVVRQELIAREVAIQGELLTLMPLMKFASVEPTFGQPFKAAVIARVIRSHQLILDRLRESRTAIGTEGFSPEIRRNFSDVLVPYRKQGKRVTRALFYFTATSLSTKQPLPPDLPSMVATSRNIQHDAMVLSRRLTKTEEGRQILSSQVFLRYWFFLTAFSSTAYLLEGMEPELRELFGTQEDSPFIADALADAAF